MRRYSVIPRANDQLTIDIALLKLLQTIVSRDCTLRSWKADGIAELTISYRDTEVYEFVGQEDIVEPLVDICELWNRKQSELCPPEVDRIVHRDALIRRLLELALCGEDTVLKWLRECSLHDLAFVLYLVRYEGVSLEDAGSLID